MFNFKLTLKCVDLIGPMLLLSRRLYNRSRDHTCRTCFVLWHLKRKSHHFEERTFGSLVFDAAAAHFLMAFRLFQ